MLYDELAFAVFYIWYYFNSYNYVESSSFFNINIQKNHPYILSNPAYELNHKPRQVCILYLLQYCVQIINENQNHY